MIISDFENKNLQAFEYYKSIYNVVFDEICRPLFSSFDNIIKHFGYMRIFNDGHYLAFNNNKEYMEFFFQKISDNGLVFSNVIKMIPQNTFYYFPWPTSLDHNQLQHDLIFSALYKHNIWHGQNIYRKNKDYLEVWCFASDKKCYKLSELFHNNKQIFEHFTRYFAIKAESFINTNDPNRFALFKNKIDLNQSNYLDNKENINNFLQQISIKNFPFQTKECKKLTYLSQQQFNCLYYLSIGKSAKETARILDISFRTVETHLYNIRNSLSIFSQSEIITLFRENYNNFNRIFHSNKKKNIKTI